LKLQERKGISDEVQGERRGPGPDHIGERWGSVTEARDWERGRGCCRLSLL
jgi:hypothetical protein